MTTTENRREWSGLILETRIEYGHAARKNRGRFAGVAVHRLSVTYIVGLVDESAELSPYHVGQEWLRTREPVLFSCHPTCGCTSGQKAGKPVDGLTADDVTCEKCRK